MLLSPSIMRLLLVFCLVGMAVLAAFFLRQRRLPFYNYLGWGLLIVLLPLLGPFLVIMIRPGHQRDHAI